ncbi:MAG: MinD/ParA family protein [Synergistaceae bacterium]|jgi:flagellar biosynthesis protein FlhG|nr:MinD/ParA family protein [Synergistaceae bacterium]
MNPVIMPPMIGDQATALRELVLDRRIAGPGSKITGMKSIAILSGKGGVGKSNMAVNLGLAMAEMGLRVTILDADLGLANIDILFGVVPKFNIGHVLRGVKELSEILYKVGDLVSIIPGGAGLRELADLDDQRQSWMIDRLSVLEDETDVLLLDTSAGIHKNVLVFAMASDMSLLLTTPEPTAIRDSYSVLKSLCQTNGGDINAAIVVNMVADYHEAAMVSERIISTAEQFLNIKVPYMGCILWDSALREAVKRRRPLLLDDDSSVSAPCFRELAARIIEAPDGNFHRGVESEQYSFLSRLVRQMGKKGTL